MNVVCYPSHSFPPAVQAHLSMSSVLPKQSVQKGSYFSKNIKNVASRVNAVGSIRVEVDTFFDLLRPSIRNMISTQLGKK
jgi:hypothetical protein